MSVFKDKEKFKSYKLKCRKEKEINKKTYVLYDIDKKLYKIGHSKNPFNRMGIIRNKYPNTNMIAIIDASIEIELHRFFETKRVIINGEREWFLLNESDLKIIISLSLKTKREDVYNQIQGLGLFVKKRT
jgi:hypothetical protein